jgi:hypothetical protein
MSLFPIASFVQLSDGTVAQVLRANGPDFTKPVVQVVQAADGSFIDPNDPAALIDLSRSQLQITQALAAPRHADQARDCTPAVSASCPEPSGGEPGRQPLAAQI